MQYLFLSVNPVQKRQHGRDHPTLRLAVGLVPAGAERVHFVEHDQARCPPRGVGECLAESTLALPDKPAA